MKAILMIAMIGLIGCAGMQLQPLPEEKRKFVKIEELETSKAQNFNAARSFLSKSIKNSNHAFRLQDLDSGKIVAKIGFTCSGLKRPDIIADFATEVDYTVDISLRGNKVRTELVMEGFEKDLGAYGKHYMFIAKDDGQAEAVKKCNEELHQQISRGIASEVESSDW